MKIPPKEAQITHKPLFVDLERGYSKKEIQELLKNRPKHIQTQKNSMMVLSISDGITTFVGRNHCHRGAKIMLFFHNAAHDHFY